VRLYVLKKTVPLRADALVLRQLQTFGFRFVTDTANRIWKSISIARDDRCNTSRAGAIVPLAAIARDTSRAK
jgi:hypothetical protein